MTVQFKMPKHLIVRLEKAEPDLNAAMVDLREAAEAVEEFIDEMRDAHSERSDKWLESDRAYEAESWIDTFEELKDKIESFLDDADEIEMSFRDVEERPEFSE